MVHFRGLLEYRSPQALLNLNRLAGGLGVNHSLTLTSRFGQTSPQPAQTLQRKKGISFGQGAGAGFARLSHRRVNDQTLKIECALVATSPVFFCGHIDLS
jgi:hypothetical protein